MSLISPAVAQIVGMTQITINIMWVEYETWNLILFSLTVPTKISEQSVLAIQL